MSLDLEGSYRATVQGICQHGVSGLNDAKQIDGIISVTSDHWADVEVAAVVFVTKDFEQLQTIKVDRIVAVSGEGHARTEIAVKISSRLTVAPFPLNLKRY